MRLMTAKTAGTIQAAETIIQGRKRGTRTASQYALVQRSRNTNRSLATVRVRRGAARVLIVVRQQAGN